MSSCQGDTPESVVSYMEEEIAPPRKNGELIFDEPWQRRSFGMALALYEKEYLDSWEDFRSRLIKQIGTWEKAKEEDKDEWNYYEQWLAALEKLVVETNMLDKQEIETRANEFLEGKRDEAFY